MRALVIAPQPFFTPRGTPFSVYHRTRVTSEMGVEVDLLTYGEGEDVDIPGVRIIRIPRFRFLEPVPVGPSLSKLFLDVFVLARTLALLARHRYDFVHAHEEAVFFATFLKPLFRFRLVYDMHSSLPQQLTNFGFTRSRVLIGLFTRLEDAALRAADAVITISPGLAEYAVGRMGGDERHVLIENSLFEPVRLRTPPKPATASKAADAIPGDRPVVAYAGTFEAYQGIDLLLAAHGRVLQERPETVLLLIGGTPDQVAAYQGQASELGIEEACVFTGRLPQEETRELLRSAAVMVSPRTRGDNTPLKIYEILAGDIPLVATRVPSHTQVLDDAVCFLADPEPEAFAEAVLAALGSGGRSDSVVRRAQDLYRRDYSPESYQTKMRRILSLLR